MYQRKSAKWGTSGRRLLTGLLLGGSALAAFQASATPIFARQTGENCLACHAGGQFPELTPYGRMFKLTGFTLGVRTPVPLAVMGVFGSKTNGLANAPAASQAGHTQTDGTPTFDTGSIFLGGKITDNIGMLAQYTWNNYGGTPSASIQGLSDNTDIRYANRIINGENDIVYGMSFNNNPGVQDVWNSSQAWGWGVVPGSTGAFNTLLDGGLQQQAVGASAYVYWNKLIYAEVAGYRTGDGIFSFLTQNTGQKYIAGTSPYIRLAATHEWGPHNIEVGYTYLDSDIYGPYGGAVGQSSGAYTEYRDNAFDVQYQYLLDPHTFTFEAARVSENVTDGVNMVSGTDNETKLKASYTYEAKYGAALGYYDATVSYALGQSTTTAWVPEVFYMPLQNVRIGLQYTMFTNNPGANLPPPATAWNASNFNTTFLYVWAAY